MAAAAAAGNVAATNGTPICGTTMPCRSILSYFLIGFLGLAGFVVTVLKDTTYN